ncbi:MAG: c-type cytochrome [Bacteroidales bacterium]|nr:c-type cytochrome [Bacteroidales bacterium]MCF8343948.1 c-type cytochrome [Bacteroidales bacterium]MCF8351200.1 c-type cytochrome [Bacteroidales bacterium]MCF8375329.1 c-type cytochrome [Bacteroidales bacterium]MCF8400185.1 c-type cytochrome [Bacteroidales bacterium]
MKARFDIVLVCFSALLLTPAIVKAQNGEALFNQYCAACHTVGGGDLVGPDLKGVTEKRDRNWLIRFIQSSQSMIKDGDPVAISVFEKYNKIPMPDQPLTDAQAESVLEYVSGTGSATDTLAQATPAKPGPFDYNMAEVRKGLALFKGKQQFENSGVSCISCHNIKNDAVIAGGTMARDLTASYKNIGAAGIQAILSNPPFPAMTISYKNHSLTEAEVSALTAFLVESSKQAIYQHPREYTKYFVIIGVTLWLCLIGIVALIWIRRKKGSVNDAIYKRQIEIY